MTNEIFIIQYDSGNPSNGRNNYLGELFFSSKQEATDFLIEKGFKKVDLFGYDRANQPQLIPVANLYMELSEKPIWKSARRPDVIISVFERSFDHGVLFGGTTKLFDRASIVKLTQGNAKGSVPNG